MLALLLAVADYQGNRYNLNPDGISYLEMAQRAWALGPSALINGYWSPAYPALLVPVFAWTRGDWATRIPVLHAVNLVVFALALGVVVALMRGAAPARSPLGRWTTAIAVMLFAVVEIRWIGLGLVTPDLLVLLLVLVAALAVLRLEHDDRPMRWSVVLGASLAAGFWAKGMLLPLGALLLALLAVFPPRIAGARRWVAVSAAVFAVLSAPLILLVSRHVGHASIGEVGKLNYAWEVDGVESFAGWRGDSVAAHGTPIHPPRLLQADPETLEFATPVPGTYPLWYEPSYWYAGVRARPELRGQVDAIVRNFTPMLKMAEMCWPVVVVLIGSWLVARRERTRFVEPERMPLVLLVWSLGAAAAYVLVHVEPRYLAGFLVLVAALAWRQIVVRETRRSATWMAPGSALLLLACSIATVTANPGSLGAAYRPDYLTGAAALRGAGVAPGDAVAAVGDAFEQYAALGADAKIVAQVVDSAGFWNATPAVRRALADRIAATGARALLANNVDSAREDEGWRRVGYGESGNLGILVLKAPPP